MVGTDGGRGRTTCGSRRHRFSALVAAARISAVPQTLLEQWPRLLGEALAEHVWPVSLCDWGQELLTEASSAQARDEFAAQAPALLSQIRELLGAEGTISRIPAGRLPPVQVMTADQLCQPSRAPTSGGEFDVPHAHTGEGEDEVARAEGGRSRERAGQASGLAGEPGPGQQQERAGGGGQGQDVGGGRLTATSIRTRATPQAASQ